MAAEPEELTWPSNYFNYFTEAEEHFQKARGTGLFLMSPLDWSLVEAWKNAGIPLEAVLRGIDAAFEKWRSRKNRIQMVNSLAYCSQAVLAEAQAMAGVVSKPQGAREAPAPFSLEEVKRFVAANRSELAPLQGYEDVGAGLDRILDEAAAMYQNLEELEQRLTALEEKMIAITRSRQNENDLFEARRELDRELRPYRGKMSAEQLAMLERQYLDRRLLEAANLPRLSLFYLR